MKRLFMIALLFMGLFTTLNASDYRGAESIRISEGDTLHTDLFAGGRYVDILGVVNGDVYAGAQTITVEGVVTDDVIVGGQDLTVRGKVGGGVIAFVRMVLIDGEVHGDVVAFGGQVRITERAKIHGNLLVFSGELTLDGGRVGGYVKGGCGRAYLDGSVNKYVELETDEVSFGPNYEAKEGTKLTLGMELDEDLEDLPANLEVTVKRRRLFFESGFFYWSFFSMLVAGIIFISLFKNFSRDYLTFAGENVLKSLGLGFVFLIAIPIAIVVLCVLVVTIPVGLIVLALYLIALYLSFIFSSLYVGKYVMGLLKPNGHSKLLILPILVGLVLVFLFSELPFIGWLFETAVLLFGLGSFITYLWSLRQLNNKSVQSA